MLQQKKINEKTEYKSFIVTGAAFGSSALNPGAVFLCFFTIAFLLFLTPVGGSNPAGPTF